MLKIIHHLVEEKCPRQEGSTVFRGKDMRQMNTETKKLLATERYSTSSLRLKLESWYLTEFETDKVWFIEEINFLPQTGIFFFFGYVEICMNSECCYAGV